jgi:hypothetical protein
LSGYAIQYFNGKTWVLFVVIVSQEKILTMHMYSEVSCYLKYFSKCFLVMDSGHKIALISDRQHIIWKTKLIDLRLKLLYILATGGKAYHTSRHCQRNNGSGTTVYKNFKYDHFGKNDISNISLELVE